MTQFKLISDLHLEFYGRTRHGLKDHPMWEPAETDEDKNTVLLLAGDIHVGRKALPWIEKMCERFKEVVYILGNHEFYNNEVHDVIDFWRNTFQGDNFTFLENDYFENDDEGYRIIGATLWTQVTDPHARWYGPRAMTDYQVTTIREHGKFRRMHVGDTDHMHFETTNFIRNELQKPWGGKTIVMTHHLPHPKCVAERFKGDNLTAFFMTDLGHIIENFDINVWCHGHTHDNVDVEVHGTRILCNPMGYHGIQLNQDFNEGLVFEL